MTALISAPTTLDVAAQRAAELSDGDLDHAIEVAEFVDAVNRFLRVERGRRATAYERKVTPGITFSAGEKVRRSEEMLVARFVDGDPDGFGFVAANGWRKCVTEARNRGYGNGEPTRTAKPDLGGGVTHPARFSDPILDVIAAELPEEGVVLDPFAGTGRIHEVATETRQTVGVEIEPEWASLHPDTKVGDALDLEGTAGIAPESVDAVATSPTYGNRLADHHNAADADSRRSYTHDLGRPLHENNSGTLQWGDEYRTFHLNAYREAVRALKPGGRFVLNVSDHIRGGQPQQVVLWHAWALGSLGLAWVKVEAVETRRLRTGDTADRRVDAEFVLVFTKPSQTEIPATCGDRDSVASKKGSR